MRPSVLSCESQIVRVAVYARGAEVTRRVLLPASLPSGPVELVLDGLTPQLDSEQLKAHVSGRREVIYLRSQLLAAESVASGPVQQRGRRLAREAREAEREALARVRAHAAPRAISLSNPRPSRTPSPQRFLDALAATQLLASLQNQLETRAQQLSRETDETPLPEDAPAETLSPPLARQVRLRLSPGDDILDLSISYVVPAVRWWPAYTARFHANEHRTELVLEAFIAQRSGEDWRGVSLSLCTADLPSGTQPPELAPMRAARSLGPLARRVEAPHPVDTLTQLFRSYDDALPFLPEDEEAEEEAAPSESPELERLLLAGPERPRRRGRLVVEPSPSRPEAPSIETPPLVQEPSATRGWFETRYEAAASLDLPSDGKAHRVQLRAREANAVLKFRTIPRESAEAYRQALIPNPFGQTLLSGPLDVYVNGSLLATTALSTLDRAGLIAVGLGVEERLRVARETRAEESASGLLGGRTTVTHTVSVNLSSALPRGTKVEVLERLPVSDDRSIEVELLNSYPPAEPYDQSELGQPMRGGLLWRLEVPAEGRVAIVYQYRVSLPARSELVGGNRRE